MTNAELDQMEKDLLINAPSGVLTVQIRKARILELINDVRAARAAAEQCIPRPLATDELLKLQGVVVNPCTTFPWQK